MTEAKAGGIEIRKSGRRNSRNDGGQVLQLEA
jgi:hypothetical protein